MNKDVETSTSTRSEFTAMSPGSKTDPVLLKLCLERAMKGYSLSSDEEEGLRKLERLYNSDPETRIGKLDRINTIRSLDLTRWEEMFLREPEFWTGECKFGIDTSIRRHKPGSVLQNKVTSKLDLFLLQNGLDKWEDRQELIDLYIQKLGASSKGPKPVQSKPLTHQTPRPIFKDRSNTPDRPELAGTNVVEWLRLVWGDEMKAGNLTRAQLNEVDPSAYKAVENWLRKADLPADINLPTKRQVTDAVLAGADLKQAVRLGSAARRRRLGLVSPR